MQRIASSAGYEVAREGDQLLFAYRATRGPALLAWIAGGLTMLCAVNAVVWSVAKTPVIALILGPLAVMLLFAARAGYRAYRKRRDAPVSEHVMVRADLAKGVLVTARGERLAALGDVRLHLRMNLGDSTQGFMQLLSLRWDKGKLDVYNAAKRDARALAEELARLGVGRLS